MDDGLMGFGATGLAVERSALLDPVAMGEFGLNLCGGVGWRDGFRPIAVIRTPGIPARKRASDVLKMRRACRGRLCGGSSQGCETAARQFLG